MEGSNRGRYHAALLVYMCTVVTMLWHLLSQYHTHDVEYKLSKDYTDRCASDRHPSEPGMYLTRKAKIPPTSGMMSRTCPSLDRGWSPLATLI